MTDQPAMVAEGSADSATGKMQGALGRLVGVVRRGLARRGR